MKKSKSLASILTLLCIVLCVVSMVSAESINEKNNLEDAEETHGQTIYIDPTDLIEKLSFDELDSCPYLQRAYDYEESLHDVIYHCADGNDVAYFFQYPVKYVDTDGKTKDIKTTIIENQESKGVKQLQIGEKTVDVASYKYASKENSFSVYYNDSVASCSDTIIATKDQYVIALSPIMNYSKNDNEFVSGKLVSTKGKCGKNNKYEYKSIEYENAFGEGTSLIYNTTYTGYKEIIRLDKNIGKCQFSFRLATNGLLPLLHESGNILLLDKVTNEMVARIAQIYVYDSSIEQKYTLSNFYDLKCISKENDEYVITLNIDDDFINDDSIQFPVFIDPTTIFNTSTAINDAPIYSGLPNAAVGSNYFNCIGYVDSTYQVGSLLIKFPGLQNSTWFNSLDNSRINCVIYNAYKVGGGNATSATLYAYYYNGSIWNEATITYNGANISSYTGAKVGEIEMKTNTKYMIDITNAALSWKNGTKSYGKGLVIKNHTSTTNHSYERDIASVEYGTSVDSSVMPYVAVVYNTGEIFGPYDWNDEPAMDFANRYYTTVAYTHIEFGATIYKYNNKYYYYNPHYGEPHNICISNSVPNGTAYAGFVKACYTTSSFSYQEKQDAGTNNLYLLDKDGTFWVYEGQYSYFGPYSNVLDHIYYLSEYEEYALETSLRPIWEAHFVNGQCNQGFGCYEFYWPHY